MNRENKKRQYEKGYYKTHACEESFTCRNCGRLCLQVQVVTTVTIARTVCTACT